MGSGRWIDENISAVELVGIGFWRKERLLYGQILMC